MLYSNRVLPILALAAVSIFTFLVLLQSAFAGSPASESESWNSEEGTSLQTEAQTSIQDLFNSLETVGNAYNGGGEKAAGLAALDAGCRAAIQHVLESRAFSELAPEYDLQILPSQASSFLKSKTQQLSQSALSSLCVALQGQQVASLDLSSQAQTVARTEIFPMLMMAGQNMAHGSGIPFLTRLDVEMGIGEGDFISSISTVQPLWQDEMNRHHLFTQLSWYKAPKETDEEGFRTKHDTFNAGLAYRYLTDDQKALYGANVFFDHAPTSNHNRMSLGVDARTSQLAVSANRYMPLSTWKDLDLYYEEKAAAGWDLTVRGQVPELPSWTGSLQAYQWDNQKNGEDLYGTVAAVEYSPVPALSFRLGVREESQEDPSVEAAVRFAWRFDQPQDVQVRPRTELAPVADYVYEKVQRENIIRVQKRRQASSKLTVVAATSATAVEATGSSTLRVGQTLLMPVTITVANVGGAIADLRFADGAIMTAGQDTQVLVEPNRITLLGGTGTIHYVSGSITRDILVPGGTITLHGTDIDVAATGANSSSVRVRDGSVTFAGTVAGSTTIGVEEVAQSVNGTVGGIFTEGDPEYETHADTISLEIDRVAPPASGAKVAPYPYEAPRIVTETLVVGQVMEIGLKFNDAVTVSGGTPRLTLTINGNNRTADLIGGSGTDDLLFGYTVQPADGGATTLTVTGLDRNGASVMGNGKDAVTSIADSTLTFSGSIGDVVAPAGYGASFTTDPVYSGNVTAAAFDITSAEVGSTYDYTISSSGGPATVTGSGTIAGATESVTGIDVSTLADGTLTVSVELTDPSSNTGAPVTGTATKDVTPPTINSITPPADGTYEP